MEEFSTQVAPGAACPPPVSAHFVNNVLAAAASYIDEDPDYARDVLAELGQFLSYRLRNDRAPVTLRQELDHIANYLRLQEARFPDRLEITDIADSGSSAGALVEPGRLARDLDAALGQRLRSDAGPCPITLLPRGDGLQVTFGPPDAADADTLMLSFVRSVEVPR